MNHAEAMKAMIAAHELAAKIRGHRDAAKALLDLAEWILGSDPPPVRDQIVAELRRRTDLILQHGNDLAQQAQAEMVDLVVEMAESRRCCWKHAQEAGIEVNWMVLCPECGNKRCPKATDCSLACTHSNDVGQPGSRYTLPKETP